MKRLLRVIGKLLKFAILAFLVVVVAIAAFIGYLAIARNAALALPAPTGSYAVGRSEFNWVDSAPRIRWLTRAVRRASWWCGSGTLRHRRGRPRRHICRR